MRLVCTIMGFIMCMASIATACAYRLYGTASVCGAIYGAGLLIAGALRGVWVALPRGMR